MVRRGLHKAREPLKPQGQARAPARELLNVEDVRIEVATIIRSALRVRLPFVYYGNYTYVLKTYRLVA